MCSRRCQYTGTSSPVMLAAMYSHNCGSDHLLHEAQVSFSAAHRAAVFSGDISGFGLQISLVCRALLGQAASSIMSMAKNGLLT